MEERINSTNLNFSEVFLDKCQNIVNILASVINIPAALIMRLVNSDIEVFSSGHSEGNPYHPGDHEHFFNSGLYIETVIKFKIALWLHYGRKIHSPQKEIIKSIFLDWIFLNFQPIFTIIVRKDS
ncbi:MAG: hypothetical protein KDK36_07200 [Leptospiraceae bacterium]|nr:hypothetical protein [Leptospiraceae bacterium]